MIKQENNQNKPLVAISLLNWMNYTDTIRCVETLSQLNYSNYVLLIRDNASPNESFERLKEAFPDLKIVRSIKNNGFAAGHYENYILAKELNSDLFWILNSDLEVYQETLSSLIKEYNKQGEHIFGSVSLNPENSDLIDFGGAALGFSSIKDFTFNTWKDKSYSNLIAEHPEKYETESVEGSSMLIPMRVIEKYGFMKLDFFMYGEEVDYCFRMREQGVQSFVVTNSCVKHHNEGSLQSNPNLKFVSIYYKRRNVNRIMIEHFGIPKIKTFIKSNSFFNILKTLAKGIIMKKKSESYYYALASFHSVLSIKGKKVSPEKILNY